MKLDKNYVGGGAYKSPLEIDEEYNNLKALMPDQIKNPQLFPKDKNFFIQIVPDEEFSKANAPEGPAHPPAEMHPHYYWIKKVVRQHKRQYLFPYKLNAKDFRSAESMKIVQDKFNIVSYEELNDILYIIVNQDKMSLPIGGRFGGQSEISSSIPIKFVTNPLRITSEDELFDLLDANRGSPVKYFFIVNPNNQKNPGKDMNMQQKIFRKFFYENSSFIDSEVVFAEICDRKLALKSLGLKNETDVAVIQNKNPFSSLDTTMNKT